MRVLLAVGNEKTAKEIAEHLINNGIEVRSCYNRIAVTAAAKEHQAEVVVLSPVLPGDEDLVADVVRPLWNDGIRIVLLPGDADLPDTRDLVKKVIPYRVYDFVYDPVTPEKVLERLNNPGLPADLPKDLVRAAMLEETVSDNVPDIMSAGSKNRWGLLTKIAKKRRWKDTSPDARAENIREDKEDNVRQSRQQAVPAAPPEGRQAETVVGVPVKEEWPFLQTEKTCTFKKQEEIPEDFALLGSKKFPSVPALLAALPGGYTAVVLPSGWPNLAETIKQIRREPSASALLIVVVGPCDTKECYAAGADECVEMIRAGVIERVRAKAARMKELWEQAEKDPLTGLYNRRFLEKFLTEKEMQYKEEKRLQFSVALLDLDRFKNVNDTYGHQAGDVLLKEFAAYLCQSVRKTDVISRYGGEEFVIVFPGVRNAWGIVERLRRGWAGREIALPGREAVKSTFSAGLATIGKDAANCSDLIKAADKALYRAKERGRNRVEMDVKKLYVAGTALKLRLPKEIKTTKKPSEADFALVDAFSYRNVPDGVPLIVVKSGTVADFPVLTTRPDAVVLSPEEAVKMIADLFLGIRSNEPASIPLRLAEGENKGVIYVVCPARPESAGEVAAEMARKNPGSALVCASSNSTGALALGMPPEDLICSDWRLPGSSAPVVFNGVTVWPVDPLKYLDVKAPVDELVSQISRKFPLVVVDCSGNLELCARVPKHYKVVVIDHSSSKMVELWLKNYGGENVEIVA